MFIFQKTKVRRSINLLVTGHYIEASAFVNTHDAIGRGRYPERVERIRLAISVQLRALGCGPPIPRLLITQRFRLS